MAIPGMTAMALGFAVLGRADTRHALTLAAIAIGVGNGMTAGLVQVLAQDLGIPSGVNQRNIVQTEAVQFLMLWGGAYALTGHRSEGMVSALLYFVLRLNISNGETSNVCFEEV